MHRAGGVGIGLGGVGLGAGIGLGGEGLGAGIAGGLVHG